MPVVRSGDGCRVGWVQQPRSALAFAIFAMVLATTACPDSPSVACARSDDCREGEVCVEELCRAACNSITQCRVGEVCQSGYCQARADAGLSDGGESDTATTDAVASDVARTDAAATDVTQTDTAATDVALNDTARSDGAAPQDAAGAGDAGCGRPLLLSTPLLLSSVAPVIGERLSAAAVLTNPGCAVALRDVAIAARPPGGTNEGGPYRDLARLGPQTLAAGGTLDVAGGRVLALPDDPPGAWYAYVTYEDEAGWHDFPQRVDFTVIAAHAGATLPIAYDLGALPGTKRYVASTGSDTTGDGTSGAPYATVARAVSVAVSNDSIVIRGGTYREGGISLPAGKTLHLAAYPGETPVFIGAQPAASGWVVEGPLQYRPYTPMPVTDGSGISFTTGQNLTGDGVGKFPDQAWVGAEQLRQVTSKTAVAAGTFWVDSVNERIYLATADVLRGAIEVSDLRTFLLISSPGSVVEGIRVMRYSNTADDYGVINLYNSADHSTIRNVEISDTSFIALQVSGGGASLLDGILLQNMTITHSNWMGIGALYTDHLTLDRMSISHLNPYDEFAHSPQSGALKTSRTRYTVVKDSEISSNHSHGLWFDQSNVDVDVVNNRLVDNLGTAVFFEISDNLLLLDNYIRATGGARATRLAGSSGLKVINNTLVGGADTLGVFVDVRSMPGCADPAQPLCASSYSSDRDTVRTRPATLDWMPRIDALYNNIVAYPTAAGWCGGTAMCISVANGSASAPIETIIHHAESARGIAQTFMDGNVYANGTGRLITAANVAYSSLGSFTSAMAGAPVLIAGIEANGKAGDSWVNADGSPTAALAAAHGQAIPIPVDAEINQYVSPGTRHYGAW